MQAFGITNGRYYHINLFSYPGEGGKCGVHHYCGNIAYLYILDIYVNSHLFQHIDEPLNGKVCSPFVSAPIKANDQTVTKKLVCSDTFYSGNILDSCTDHRRGKKEINDKDNK